MADRRSGGSNNSPKAGRPTRKRVVRTRASDERVHYLLQVTGWDYYYSLRSGDPKSRWDVAAYSELATLDIAGNIIEPENSKYATGKMTVSARKGLLQEPLDKIVHSLGTLSGRGYEIEAYVFVPAERMPELITLAQSSRMRIVQITGTKLRYGSGLIYGISLHTRDDEC